MLTDAEREIVAGLLLTASQGQISPRQFLAAGLLPRLQRDFGEGSPGELVPRAIELVCAAAYADDPPALVHLLMSLLPGEAAIDVIVERLRIPPPAHEAMDPVDAVILVSKLPFLERSLTRTALRTFLHQRLPQQPVVVVDGEAPGKTYTGTFVDHVLSDQHLVRPCRIELCPTQGSSTGPAELARDLMTAVGGDAFQNQPPDTNRDRWTQDLANWVLGAANRPCPDCGSPVRWWFVLDGFTKKELRPDTRLFIVNLATTLQRGVNRERHRLILTAFDRNVLPLRPGSIALETTAPIPHSAIQRAVARMLPNLTDDLDQQTVTSDILLGLPDPVTDLLDLGRRLGDLIGSMEHPATAGAPS